MDSAQGAVSFAAPTATNPTSLHPRELLSEHLESSSKSLAFRVYLLLSIKAKQSGWHSSEVLNTYQGDARRAQQGYVF